MNRLLKILSVGCAVGGVLLTVAASASAAMLPGEPAQDSRPADDRDRGWVEDGPPPPPPDDQGPPWMGRPDRRMGESGEGGRPRMRPRFKEGFGPDRGPMPPELIDRAMTVIREKFPEYHARLERLRAENPRRFEAAVHVVLPVVMEYLEIRDRHPEMADTIIAEFRIEQQLAELSRQYRAAAERPEAQADLARQIEELVREQTELRFRRQAFRLDEFERRLREQQSRLEEQRARLEQEMKDRDDLIARRVEEVKQGRITAEPRQKGPRPPGFRGFGRDRDGPPPSPERPDRDPGETEL